MCTKEVRPILRGYGLEICYLATASGTFDLQII
jgi:hypothetical protein